MMKFVKKWKPEVDKEIMKSLVGTVPEVWERSKDYFLRGGKRLRPALVLLGAKEAGGTETKSLRVAAAIEIMHTFTLIHDDIEDSSEFRRGDRCLHKQYGIPLAINTGDALFAKSFQLFTEESQELANEFAKTMCTIVEGQELDISWSKENRIPTEAEYISMVEKKTSELIGFSLEAGYMSASGKRSPKLREYGKRLGVAFQIIDDILGVAGNPDKTGKDVDKDIGERKKSLPIIHAIENHP
ncbi:MAG: polyprenyl synthetase family protein, partial [Candidatus Altiarchaeota archaeon]|nr:polyprenyl synthetase family protein [Candidatus Altiarchaeota archaeon]